ncbi:hypothetical protein EGR_10329 [Echinococcus granulosus]|uniref:Uncharacterized protein n=1 Tax=Echinococcus granulosus TaxID=6210 RepID=W6U8L9_ECHGR|nr:hypothetical protein EGR_10329 [Echinococcus granulosus]EUB54822.1 hypothetical protein EGR_10329 [Echinococcus granulosus]
MFGQAKAVKSPCLLFLRPELLPPPPPVWFSHLDILRTHICFSHLLLLLLHHSSPALFW